MHSLHYATPGPSLAIVLVIPRPTLPYKLEGVPCVNRGAILQQIVPQTLREDALAALSRAEIWECVPPRVRDEVRADDASRARAMYRAAAPCAPTAAMPAG
jgi:hypothetical protein